MFDFIPGQILLGSSININGWVVQAVYRDPDFLVNLGNVALPGYLIDATGVTTERFVTGTTTNSDHIVIHSLPLSHPALYTTAGTAKGSLKVSWLTSATMLSIVSGVIPEVGDTIDHLLPGVTYTVAAIAPPVGLLQTLTVTPWWGK